MMSHGYKPVGGLFPETSVGWYRKYFTIARRDSGQRHSITFDGIFRDARIWVNGFYLGNNESGYIGVTYDITEYINYNSDNIIVVRADASQYEGWFYEGAGIYRHVLLNNYHPTHIATDGVFAYAVVKKNNAIVAVETTVNHQGFFTANCTVQAYITDRKVTSLLEVVNSR
jgi:beta-galactosidase